MFAFCFQNIPVCDAEIPVLLRVPRAEQPDTLGANFVEQITALVYEEVIEGRIKLWDSPEKEIQITGNTLTELEKTSQTKFTEQGIIFIYENWQKTKISIVTQTLGFAFLNYDQRGQEVSYGYVDYYDLKETLMRKKINTNANGNYDINYATYLFKKLFNFNIVQFNGKAITTGGESKDIKNDYIGNFEFNRNISLPLVSDRYITYIIDNKKNLDDQKNKNSIEILNQIGLYLSSNEEMFYNLGGDKILNFLKGNKIKVSSIQVEEIWKKTYSEISSDTKSIPIFVNDSALMPVAFDDFINWGIQVNDKSSYEIFKEKYFSFIITLINSQKISRKDSYLYQKGLLTYDWKKLTEFVKYY